MMRTAFALLLCLALAGCTRPEKRDPAPVLVFCDGGIICIPI